MELKWFHLVLQFYFILFENATVDAKTCFLNVGHTRKSQIAVIMQASWHYNISFLFMLIRTARERVVPLVLFANFGR